LSAKSECRGICLARADANRVVEIDDEDLAVADLSGFCRSRDGFDGFVDLIRGDSDFDFESWAGSSPRIRRRDRFPYGPFAGHIP